MREEDARGYIARAKPRARTCHIRTRRVLVRMDGWMHAREVRSRSGSEIMRVRELTSMRVSW